MKRIGGALALLTALAACGSSGGNSAHSYDNAGTLAIDAGCPHYTTDSSGTDFFPGARDVVDCDINGVDVSAATFTSKADRDTAAKSIRSGKFFTAGGDIIGPNWIIDCGPKGSAGIVAKTRGALIR